MTVVVCAAVMALLAAGWATEAWFSRKWEALARSNQEAWKDALDGWRESNEEWRKTHSLVELLLGRDRP